MPNKYSDSMSLMALSTKVNELPIVVSAMIGMGTDLNKQVIEEVGLSTPETEKATSRDQIVVVQCATEADCDTAIEQVETLRSQGAVAAAETSYRTSRQAYAQEPDASLAIISVPGQYAADEARTALSAGRNVLVFSDNVTVEDELDIKRQAHDAGLLVMGPDCGTAIINGTGLCFANAVSRGSIGVVAASGTGSQELSVRIDALGSGISQLVGVGGRDLSEAIGGIMMLDAMRMLAADPQTSVVVLLSKPPAAVVAERVLEAAAALSKPVVVCFIGAPAPSDALTNVTFTATSRDAALAAVALQTGEPVRTVAPSFDVDTAAVRAEWHAGQSDIRGLFCGGTVCDEVFHVLKGQFPDRTRSNVAKDPAFQLAQGAASTGHVLIDLGADEYTQGRPHPMIDPTIRNAEIVKAASDPATAVIVLDVELGFGSHPDPAGAAVPAISEARKIAADAGRPLEFVAYVLGTDRDPQNKSAQVTKLTDLGVRVVDDVIELATLSLEMTR
ncbi:MAG: acyl-CoA synthetase FdrA [Humibacillus sp.]|nr:acyl-CoA synthetase FdrA [Humibacillus sp.]